MPRKSLQLNDFSGGLNTKSSPRDIKSNQVQKAENVVLSNPGLITAASDSVAKLSTANAPSTATAAGYGAFMFNSQYNADVDAGSVTGPDCQIFAFPEDGSGNTKILTYTRDFGVSEDFILTEATGDASIDMQVTGAVLPVYYYADGVLYVSDEKVVDGTNSVEPRKLQYVSETRLASSTTVVGWNDATLKVQVPGTSNFESITETSNGNFSSNPDNVGGFDVILNTDPSTVSTDFSNKQQDSSNIITTTNPGETAPSPNEDIGLLDKTIYLKTLAGDDDMTGAFSDGEEFFINGEGFKVRGINVLSPNTVVQLVVDRDVYGTGALEHGGNSNVQTQSSNSTSVTGGGWEAGTYEFTHTVIDLQDNETLPQAIHSNVFNIITGSYFTRVGLSVKFNDWSTRKNEKGVRIYTRKKGGNGRWILFLDVNWRRGIRSNLFEKYQTGTNATATDGFGDAVLTNFKQIKNLDIVNPSLDTYESINGYSQDEESIDFGTDGGYKAATVCSRRAWVANVRKDDKLFDDRIYYTPPNRFATFPDSYYLDIGINDGDSFTALHSFGNRLLAFKQKKLYVINVSSSSDAGWYLEAEYDGMGCINQNSVTKTPYGTCWVNGNGVYLYDAQSMPKELTANLDDSTWFSGQEASNVLHEPSIGYDGKYKQLFVLQDADVAESAYVYVFDFSTTSWVTRNSIGADNVSNFINSYDGIYFWKHSDNKIHRVNGDTGTKLIKLQTKDIDFGNPGLVKRVKKVYITAKDDGSGNSLILKFGTDGASPDSTASFPTDGVQDGLEPIASSSYKILTYAIGSATGGKNCESIAFELVDVAEEAITINDINIDYRLTNKRPSNA